MQKTAYPFCGPIIHEENVPNYKVSYRWHLTDPVRFNKKIKVILESGHANNLRVTMSSSARTSAVISYRAWECRPGGTSFE